MLEPSNYRVDQALRVSFGLFWVGFAISVCGKLLIVPVVALLADAWVLTTGLPTATELKSFHTKALIQTIHAAAPVLLGGLGWIAARVAGAHLTPRDDLRWKARVRSAQTLNALECIGGLAWASVLAQIQVY